MLDATSDALDRTRGTRSPVRALTRWLLVALLVAAAGSLLAARDGAAATYTVWSCRALDGTPLTTEAWQGSGSAGTRSDDCATGGALRAELDQTDTGAGDVGGWQLAAPAGTTIERYRLWRAALVPATSTAFAAGTAGASGLGGTSFNDGCLLSDGVWPCDYGSLIDPDDPGNVVDSGSGSFGGVTIGVRCVLACAASADPAASVALYRSAVELSDTTPPVVGLPAGSLFEPGAIAGRHSLVVPVADLGGGVARTDLLVDGALVQSTPTAGTCVEPYTDTVPCARQVDRGFVVDTAPLAAGWHSLVVRAVDAAGNATDGAAVPFLVTHPVPPPPYEPPVVVPQRALRLQLTGRAALPRTDWRLGTARWADDGAVAAGVPLDVFAGPIGAAADELEWLTRISTDAEGRFVLPRSSSSRMLRVQPADASQVATPADVQLVAPLRVRLRKPARAVRNGSATTLRGTISGAGAAVEGMPVQIQAVVNGKWSTIDVVEASRSGAIRWNYTFRRTLRTSEYRFRLVVRSQRSLPWKTTASPRQIVRVVPRSARR